MKDSYGDPAVNYERLKKNGTELLVSSGQGRRFV